MSGSHVRHASKGYEGDGCQYGLRRGVIKVHDAAQFRIVATDVAVMVAADSFSSGTTDDHG